MQYQFLLLHGLSLLASVAAVPTTDALKLPTVASQSHAKLNEVSFNSLNGTNGATFRSFFRTPSANEITGAVYERSADASQLAKRTIYGPICSGGHTPPSRDDCVRVINSWAAIRQNRALAQNSCSEIVYGSCLGYICATRCNAITYNTDYVAARLRDINSACVINQGEAGYFHSTGGTNSDGTGYAKFEIGLERYSGELPPYEPCPA